MLSGGPETSQLLRRSVLLQFKRIIFVIKVVTFENKDLEQLLVGGSGADDVQVPALGTSSLLRENATPSASQKKGGLHPFLLEKLMSGTNASNNFICQRNT